MIAKEEIGKKTIVQVPDGKVQSDIQKSSLQTLAAKLPPTDPAPVSFKVLLEKNLFEDAMLLYMDAEESDLAGYMAMVINYFQARIKTSSNESIGEMLQFIEIEPESRKVQYLLVSLYIQKKEYLKAIDQIIILKENYTDESDEKKLNTLLKSSADSYIETLQQHKNFAELIPFLEQMMGYDLFKTYYALGLAKLYFDLQKYDESRTLLLEVKEDETYGRQAQNLLDKIGKLEEVAKEYDHKIPLQRRGEHFSVQVTIDGATSLNLLLDTGATYTLVTEGKLFSPAILKRNLKLRTAGGEITADLCRMETFALQDIELHHFKIMVAPFEHKGIDGLLGMNFFKKFKFYIDQKEMILYLSEKK